MVAEEPSECAVISAGDPACEHERVFSGERHPTHIPIWFFVCAKCGRVGKACYDRPDLKPTIDLPRFAQLMLEHHGERYWIDWLERRRPLRQTKRRKAPPPVKATGRSRKRGLQVGCYGGAGPVTTSTG